MQFVGRSRAESSEVTEAILSFLGFATMTSASESSLAYVSALNVLISASPLLVIAMVSHSMDLKLESPITVGCLRSFVQLSILGLILQPIFVAGEEHCWVVLAYVLLMILLTASESVSRTKYQFHGMFGFVLVALLINVAAISIFAFGFIIKPQPVLWEPQYVIPITGMILGNCINGISLSLNNLLTSLVENQHEVDLLLSFGADSTEASSRIVREAVRTGTMPLLNGMAVIGIVSIPGMMTGQILGGTPVMEAARYQMVIIYLITISSFGSILTIVFLSLRVVFDVSTDMLHVDRLVMRKEKRSFLDTITFCCRSLCRCCSGVCTHRSQPSGESRPLAEDIETSPYAMPGCQIQISTLIPSSDNQICLNVNGVSQSFATTNGKGRRFLFHDLSFALRKNEILLVGGPSGSGKSQLLRVIAGLSPQDSDGGSLMLQGRPRKLNDMAMWRQHVRYVSQSTVDTPGTPRDFIDRITSFRSRRRDSGSLSHDEMMVLCRDFLTSWGMEASSLEKSWSMLSGGEAQRIIVAIALASHPRVLLLDECTSALDLATKILVEQSVEAFAKTNDSCVLWVTHDVEQVKRMSRPGDS